MRKAIFIFLGSFVAVAFLATAISTFSYQKYWAKDLSIDIVVENLKWFHESYQECRDAFRNAALEQTNKYQNVVIGSFPVLSKIDDDLTIDWCYIPAQEKFDRLLILTSGVHGIEGYTGSAVQLMFMNHILPEISMEETGVLLIHGLNPYGFKYHRKVTENNVDLNRNCVNNPELFNTQNEGYAALTEFLMPEGKVNTQNLRNTFFHLTAIHKIIKESMPVLRQAALQGQYDFDKGIYYGGTKHEPQISALKPFLKTKMNAYNKVLNVDLHTAYGERGTMHLFINPVDDTGVMDAIEYIFHNEDIDWGDSDDFYSIHGGYLEWSTQLPDSALCIPMLFEFGTLNSQTTFGSLKSIQIMINENQGVHYGFKNNKSEEKVKQQFLEMYYPSSKTWRSKVIADSKEKLTVMMEQFDSYVYNVN
jgi:hypothetical protein